MMPTEILTDDNDTIILAALLDEDEESIDSFSLIDDCFDTTIIEALQLQEIIMASLIESSSVERPINHADSESVDHQNIEESSDCQSSVICEICTEKKENNEMVRIKGCDHFYCNECINNHVEAKLSENIHMSLKCPAADCVVELDFDSCKEIVSKDVSAKWDQALFENSILDLNKFYCPYKDCSAMMLNDCDEVIIESECPNCWRLFCAACRVPWHSGVGCEEFQATAEGEREREDFMLRELVKQKEWNRCPRCKYYVEKSSGCLHITCRCGFEFCYACGDTYTNTHNCNRSG